MVAVDLGRLVVGHGVALHGVEMVVAIATGRHRSRPDLGHPSARVHPIACFATGRGVVAVALGHFHEVWYARSQTAVVGVI